MQWNRTTWWNWPGPWVPIGKHNSTHHSLLDRLHRRELHGYLDVARLECLDGGGEILPRKSIGEERRELTGEDECSALEEGCFCESSASRNRRNLQYNDKLQREVMNHLGVARPESKGAGAGFGVCSMDTPLTRLIQQSRNDLIEEVLYVEALLRALFHILIEDIPDIIRHTANERQSCFELFPPIWASSGAQSGRVGHDPLGLGLEDRDGRTGVFVD